MLFFSQLFLCISNLTWWPNISHVQFSWSVEMSNTELEPKIVGFKEMASSSNWDMKNAQSMESMKDELRVAGACGTN